MGFGRYYDYPEYVPVARRRAKAERKLKELQKKNPNLKPIVLEGRTLAHTWWGKAWNKNLEKYADFSNRIGRGRNYVRHGSVLDLDIKAGKVKALVMGSRSTPYKVEITIEPIGKANWKQLKEAAAQNLSSLQQLLTGQFPKTLAELFTAKDTGLFPTPQEIVFKCSCPDWATMCKHVAAVLYGIGARLDQDPNLFFTLRDVNRDDLIAEAVQDQSRKLMEQSTRASTRVLTDTDLSDVFGIDLEAAPTPAKPKRKKVVTKASKKKTVKKSTGVKKKTIAKKTKKKVAKKRSPKKKVVRKKTIKRKA